MPDNKHQLFLGSDLVAKNKNKVQGPTAFKDGTGISVLDASQLVGDLPFSSAEQACFGSDAALWPAQRTEFHEAQLYGAICQKWLFDKALRLDGL